MFRTKDIPSQEDIDKLFAEIPPIGKDRHNAASNSSKDAFVSVSPRAVISVGLSPPSRRPFTVPLPADAGAGSAALAALGSPFFVTVSV